MPKSYSKLFFEKMLKKIRYVNEKNGVYYVECNVRPDDIYFMFNERWIQISGDDMVMDISPEQDMSLCIINFLPSVDEYWVLGNSIYKDYYVTHMPDTHKMQFTPTEKLVKEPLYADVLPTQHLKEFYDGWMLFAKFMSSVVLGLTTWLLSKYVFITTDISFLN